MKKLLSIILALAMLLSSSMLVSADDGSGKKDVGEHEHQLMKMANLNCHYEECTICYELFNVGDHTFKDGKCTVCGHDEYVNPFADVPKTAWYHDDIVAAASLNLINGKTADRFAPDDNLTYAEAAKLAACMNQLSTEGKVTLKNGNPWYQTYVDYCKEHKIISKDYNWTQKATRAGYVEIFANALTDEALKAINDVRDAAIPDVPADASYAPAVYKMYRAGIIQGVDLEYNFKPNANIKRGEVATILIRMMNEEVRVEFDLGSMSSGTVIYYEETPADDEDKNEEENNTPDDTDATNSEEDVTIEVLPTVDYTPGNVSNGVYVVYHDLEIAKQPEGAELDSYGVKHELEVQVFGGKGPYTYEWYYYTGHRNEKAKIENGDYSKDADTAALVLSGEKENVLLGKKIYCTIKDSLGASVTTNNVIVYGPFSVPVDSYSIVTAAKKYQVVGRVADGILRKGEKVSLIRNDKVIAIGVAEDLQMFNKSLDETCKGDNVGIIFDKTDGAAPAVGDIVVKYQPMHVVDTSDIVN
ncbi:MAG: S-layer homology domain-containing protein [Oscillospiraceae bacterium]|nr:S-layer homology domain-containing protein [Oscillospiraceae bacterium]